MRPNEDTFLQVQNVNFELKDHKALFSFVGLCFYDYLKNY